MKLRYIRAFIVLLAGLIAIIINMCMGRKNTFSLFIVLVVLLVFYVIGTLVVEILEKGMERFNRKESVEDTEETEDENPPTAESEQMAGTVHFDEDEEDE